MGEINRNQSSKAVHTVPCSATDVPDNDHVRVITTRRKTPGHQYWMRSASKTDGRAGNPASEGARRLLQAGLLPWEPPAPLPEPPLQFVPILGELFWEKVGRRVLLGPLKQTSASYLSASGPEDGELPPARSSGPDCRSALLLQSQKVTLA